MNISIEKCESRYKMSLKKVFVFHPSISFLSSHWRMSFACYHFFSLLMRYEWKYDNLLSLAQGEITVNKIFRMSTSQRARKQLVDLERYRSSDCRVGLDPGLSAHLFSHFPYEDKVIVLWNLLPCPDLSTSHLHACSVESMCECNSLSLAQSTKSKNPQKEEKFLGFCWMNACTLFTSCINYSLQIQMLQHKK